MNEKIIIRESDAGSEQMLAVSKEDSTKEYLSYSKKLLDDFKMMQNVIQEAEGPDISILIKVAQKNLTTTAMEQSDDMIKEFQLNFSEKSVETFIEQSITLITSVETANYLYGNMIDVKDIRRYISAKVTKILIIRSEKLMEQLKVTNYEEKSKLNFIVENLNLCIKIFDYSWDIYHKNIKSLQQSNKIVNRMITHRVKLGLDNYNIELLRIIIDRNTNKIRNIKHSKVEENSIIDNGFPIEGTKSDKEYSSRVIISEDKFFANLDFEENNTDKALVQSNNTITDRFLDITNNVIKEVTESSSNDFLNIALQKFYSIIGAIETMNYLKGNIVNKQAISHNISMLLTDMIYSNYTAISISWKEITDKSPEDYSAYAKEIRKYCEILIESYEMCKENIDALKKCVLIENDIYEIKEEFHFSKADLFALNRSIDSLLSKINKVDPNFKIERKVIQKETKKKKGLWAKIFK
ncbi:hypothetical protein ACQPU1_08545 [Clostridium paraputrificum]|uniref:hypothetical protein n=1 Tax=Clostridium TaxID=1485 RepID=UPI003D34714C